MAALEEARHSAPKEARNGSQIAAGLDRAIDIGTYFLCRTIRCPSIAWIRQLSPPPPLPAGGGRNSWVPLRRKNGRASGSVGATTYVDRRPLRVLTDVWHDGAFPASAVKVAAELGVGFGRTLVTRGVDWGL